MADPTRMFLPLQVVAAGATDIGKVRVHNEDAILLRPDLDLYILADGAGAGLDLRLERCVAKVCRHLGIQSFRSERRTGILKGTVNLVEPPESQFALPQ